MGAGAPPLPAGIDAQVKLIPLNPTAGFAGAATEAAAAMAFQRVLHAADFTPPA